MVHISLRLTNYLVRKSVINQSESEIYQYGFQTFLELFVNVICSIIIALLLDMKLECILFFLFFIPLRSYSGGYHMNTYLSCLFFSCLTLMGVLLCVKYFTPNCLISICIYLLSLVTIVIIGPVDHPNREVDEDENYIFKKRTKGILIISSICAAIMFILRLRSFLFLESLVFALVAFTIFLGKLKYS